MSDDPPEFAGLRAVVTGGASGTGPATTRLLGGIDILVDNAGTGAQGTIEDNTDDERHGVFDANVLAVTRVTRPARPRQRLTGSAAIVNTRSIAATASLPERALHSATKCAVLSLPRATAAEHLPSGADPVIPRHR